MFQKIILIDLLDKIEKRDYYKNMDMLDHLHYFIGNRKDSDDPDDEERLVILNQPKKLKLDTNQTTMGLLNLDNRLTLDDDDLEL